jgi:hypothetical protein
MPLSFDSRPSVARRTIEIAETRLDTCSFVSDHLTNNRANDLSASVSSPVYPQNKERRQQCD